MNIMFWSLLILMLLGAIAIMVWPLLRVSDRAMLAYRQSNLEINRQKLEELDLDLKEGRIDEAMYRIAREELDRELLVDIPEESADTASEHYPRSASRQPVAAILVALFLPAAALLLYLDLGMHSASDESFVAEKQMAPQQMAPQQMSVAEMAQKLEQHIEANGGTLQDWSMLGQAHKHLGEYELAEGAFRAALEIDPQNAQIMLMTAETIALQNDRVFNEQARELINRAYEIAPDDPNSLWFSGVAAYQSKDYQKAIDQLVALMPIAVGDEQVMKSVVAIVAQSREALIEQGQQIPELEQLLGIEALVDQMNARSAAQASAQGATRDPEPGQVSQGERAAVPVGRNIAVSVDVDDKLRAQFGTDTSVFVYASAKQGPRMPLAVQRMQLSDLPARVLLDDSMAMVEGMNLSAFDALVVSARISKAGTAIAQPGDYIGTQDVDAKQLTDESGAVAITIDTRIE